MLQNFTKEHNTTKRTACLLVAAFVLLSVVPASADPAPIPPVEESPAFIQWVEPTVLCWPGFTGCITLAPGYYLSEPRFNILDTEMRRLQDQETRLIAENNSLRTTADSVPWPILAATAGVALVLGVYIGLKF